ncbi:hypothetical protein U9M48_029973 [Paspalum notatum var. saurae]|uniref:Uncharacterized protein n=1 Tax=Paspalum notatum var. saurae TaxID=547442 RepID=A0AAQ3U4F5_PASNO
MDKILAFSILSSSPADISSAGGAFFTRLSWRTSAAGSRAHQEQQQAPSKPDDKAAERQGSSPRPAPAEGSSRKETRPRFAPEFDGINCFESIVSF